MISVVVPVRNGMPWLEQQMTALLEQECPEPWEVVIADNGSTDGSQDVGHHWADRHEEIRWLDASARRGPAAARNAGVRAARGELLAFCDADDIAQPGWLAACVKALAEADVMAGIFDFSSLNGGPRSAPQPAAMGQFGFLPAGLSANLAVRRKALEAVGGFAEELFVGEDIDLCWRLQLDGYRFVIDPGAVMSKREPPDFRAVFHQASAFGRCGPTLYRRYRSAGAHRDLAGAAKSWLWLILHLPGLAIGTGPRTQWARAAGMRTGRLVGSIRERVFFP
jgi:glycosyltransferase involved in cell wall biosynthesis